MTVPYEEAGDLPDGGLLRADNDDPPRVEDATTEDLRLAIAACGSRAMYGGFVRIALAAIYAERARVPKPETAALLNGVMDRYADLLAFVQVTAKVTGPEVDRHVAAFMDASARVQSIVPPEQYGPDAPGFENL